MYDLSFEEVQTVTRFLNAESKEMPSNDTVKKFFAITASLQGALMKANASLQRQLGAAQKRLDRFARKEEAFVAEYGYPELGPYALDVADALVWALQQQHVYFSTMKLVYVLYEVYTTWLAGNGERATVEHPVMTQFGPQYWNVYRKYKGSVSSPVSKEAWDRLAARYPGLAKLVWNAARKYSLVDEADMKAYFIKSLPCQKASPDRHAKDPKWNNPIDDNLIVAWRKGLKR